MCKLSCLSQAEQLSKVRQPGLQEVRPGMLMLAGVGSVRALKVEDVRDMEAASRRTMHARLAGKNSDDLCDGLWGVVGEKGASEGKMCSDEASGR